VTSGFYGGRRFADSIPNRVSVQLLPLIFLNLSNGTFSSVIHSGSRKTNIHPERRTRDAIRNVDLRIARCFCGTEH
jgi:hypothetical protein